MKQKIVKLQFESPLMLEKIYKQIPELVGVLLPCRAWLAGGLLRTMLDTVSLSPQVTDVDLFFKDKISKDLVFSLFDPRKGWEHVFECPEGTLTTLKNKITGWKVQLITVAYYPNAEVLLESFDFTVTQFATDGKYFWMGESSYEDVIDKRLRWNVITYPTSSLHRMTKYVKKGFTMREEDYQEFVETLWSHNSNVVDTKLVYVD